MNQNTLDLLLQLALQQTQNKDTSTNNCNADAITNFINTQDYYIVRTYSAGVFFGRIQTRNGKEVLMKDARRIWKWEGAASLSQMANEGVKRPDDCKFSVAVDETLITDAIEILPLTKVAEKNLNGVKAWTV